MAVTYFPFNSIVTDGVPDRPANAESLAAYMAGFFSNGVLMQNDTALQVEAYSGMSIQIHAGAGHINGKAIINDAAEIITLATANANLGRIDRVVFRLDEVNRLMEFDVLTGTPASSPTAPALTQGADVYEMCLAEIRVPAGATSIAEGYITDTRADGKLCGIVSIPPHMQDLAHGGTGISVETVEELLLAMGGMSKTMIWENSKVSSSFPAQELSIYLNEYDEVEVELQNSTSVAHTTKVTIRKGTSKRYTELGNVTDNKYIQSFSRAITVNSDSISFTDAHLKKVATANEVEVNNIYLIPIRIYGVKGVH